MEKASRKKRPVGRPRTGKRPVLAMRIHPDLYDSLAGSAKDRQIAIAEDAVNRIKQSFDWDRAHGDVKKLFADADRVVAGGKSAAMRAWGIQPVVGRPGLYIDTAKINPQEMIELNPAIETLIERIVVTTLEKAKQS